MFVRLFLKQDSETLAVLRKVPQSVLRSSDVITCNRLLSEAAMEDDAPLRKQRYYAGRRSTWLPWKGLHEEFELFLDILSVPEETEEDAINREYPPDKLVVRFRKNQEERELIDHNLQKLWEFSEKIKETLKLEIFDAKTARDYAALSFHAGFMHAAHALQGDEWSRRHIYEETLGGRRLDDKRVWYAKHVVELQKAGRKRKQIDDFMLSGITKIIAAGGHDGFSADWFRDILVFAKKDQNFTVRKGVKKGTPVEIARSFNERGITFKDAPEWANRRCGSLPSMLDLALLK